MYKVDIHDGTLSIIPADQSSDTTKYYDFQFLRYSISGNNVYFELYSLEYTKGENMLGEAVNDIKETVHKALCIDLSMWSRVEIVPRDEKKT